MEETKKKSQTITLIIIGIMILIIGVLVGYIVSGKLPAEKPVEEEKVEIEKKLSATEKEKFMDMVLEYNKFFVDYYPFTDSSKISNQELLNFGIAKVKNGNYEVSASAEEVEKNIYKYFGNKIKVTHEDVNCEMAHEATESALYKYDSSSKRYYNNPEHPGHGGVRDTFAQIQAYYVSGTEKDDVYTIKTKLLYGDRISGGTLSPCVPQAYYKSQEDAKNKVNPIIGDPASTVCEAPVTVSAADYERVKDQIPTTTFTFKKDSFGNYGLIKVTIK